jgi:hypothetical protein
LNAVQITVDVDLEHDRGVICWPASRQRIGAFETHLTQVQLFDEGFNNPYRIIFPESSTFSGSNMTWFRSVPSMNCFMGLACCRALPHFTLCKRFYTGSANSRRWHRWNAVNKAAAHFIR